MTSSNISPLQNEYIFDKHRLKIVTFYNEYSISRGCKICQSCWAEPVPGQAEIRNSLKSTQNEFLLPNDKIIFKLCYQKVNSELRKFWVEYIYSIHVIEWAILSSASHRHCTNRLTVSMAAMRYKGDLSGCHRYGVVH